MKKARILATTPVLRLSTIAGMDIYFTGEGVCAVCGNFVAGELGEFPKAIRLEASSFYRRGADKVIVFGDGHSGLVWRYASFSDIFGHSPMYCWLSDWFKDTHLVKPDGVRTPLWVTVKAVKV